MTAMRIAVAAGGTGGHVFPALAIADELRRRGCDVHWLAAGGMATRLAPAHGFPAHLVSFSPPRGVGGVLRLARAAWRARGVLRRLRPAAVLATGGYASAPGGLAAKMIGAPLIIHEQNAVAGRANRLLCKIARRICTGFPGVPPGGRWTGNPARREFFACPPPEARFISDSPPRRLLILGGSQGARALNEKIPAALAKLPDEFQVVHQCGRGNADDTERAYRDGGRRAEVCEFLDDVAARMTAADLVVCRAGAATLAELAAAGAAALLVPYPFAAADHQRFNARFWEERGAAFVRAQKDLDADALAEFLSAMTRPMLRRTAAAARSLARPRAAAEVAETCLEEAENAS